MKEDKYCWNDGEITEIKNEDLICKDCKYKIDGKGGKCIMFTDGKPSIVYNGICKLKNL